MSERNRCYLCGIYLHNASLAMQHAGKWYCVNCAKVNKNAPKYEKSPEQIDFLEKKGEIMQTTTQTSAALNYLKEQEERWSEGWERRQFWERGFDAGKRGVKQ